VYASLSLPSSGTGLILDTADRLVIASLLGGVAAAWYTIAYNVVTRARVLPQAIARVLYPQVSANPTGAMHVLIGSARVLTLILVPALAIGMVLIDPLCRLWIGESATKAVVPIARIMMLGVYLNCIAYVPLVALQARGDPDRLAKIHVMETPVFLIVIYFSTEFYGVTGAAIAWSVRLLIDTVILLWVAELKRVLYVDALLYMVVLLSSFAIASSMLLGLWVQVGATFVVLVTWMVVDTVIAGRTPESVTVLTLGSWARARFALVWSRSKL
jgi:O-antigen/teichoic acid export membrane protein